MIETMLGAIRTLSPQGYAFWIDGDTSIEPASVRLQDHPDIIYTLHLLDAMDRISVPAATIYVDWLATAAMHGRPTGAAIAEKVPNAHMTAYLLGSVRLLSLAGKASGSATLYQGWDVERLIDSQKLPIWPKAWTHHIWRVSHWIGGVPSILLQLAKSGMADDIQPRLVDEVLASTERRIVSPETGLLRPYKSQLIQNIFRTAYRIRHDPDLGEVGGVVHLLWVNHAIERPYVGREALYRAAERHMQAAPFLEDVPYCLDFDIVQLARTSTNTYSKALGARAEKYVDDIAAFFEAPLPTTYTLHKIPGALATMHECAFIVGEDEVRGLGVPRRDIIKDAYWI